jgi:hypothetical protein
MMATRRSQDLLLKQVLWISIAPGRYPVILARRLVTDSTDIVRLHVLRDLISGEV